MSGKKRIFKMVPGQSLFNKGRLKVFQGSLDGEELTCNNFNKIWFIPPDDEDDTLLHLPINFCFPSISSIVYCMEENGENFKRGLYDCNTQKGCKLLGSNSERVRLDYRNNSHSFVYLNEKLMKISIDYKMISRVVSSYSFIVQPVEYQYVTREESDDIYKYYFSDDQGNIIDSPDNKALQYIKQHVKEEVIQDIISSQIPEDIIVSKAFAKVFVKNLTKDQLETLVNTLNGEQIKALAEHLTDEQFLALVNHLTDHQLQTLAKDLAEHHLTILSKELEGDRLKELVNSLQEDQLKDLVNKLDPEKLEAIAQDLTDSNKIQIIIKSLADNPDKLQAFARNMSNEQFKELLNELDAEVIKDIIHKLPYEKVTAVIGDVGNKDQSKAIIDALKETLDEQNKKQEEKIEELKALLEGDDIVNPNQFSYQHSSVVNEEYYLNSNDAYTVQDYSISV